jgi:hypothetical protein
VRSLIIAEIKQKGVTNTSTYKEGVNKMERHLVMPSEISHPEQHSFIGDADT